MSLLMILLVIVVVGIVLWLVNGYIPMDATIKKLLNIVVVIVLIIWLLKAFGVWAMLASVKV